MSTTTFGSPVCADDTLMGGQDSANMRYFGLCLPLRVLGGTALAIGGKSLPAEGKRTVQAFIIVLLIAFIYSMCCSSRRSTWKNYVRPCMALSAALLATLYDRWDVAGSILAVDGLIGSQGRHTAALLQGCGGKN